MIEMLSNMKNPETNTGLEVANRSDIPKSREIFTGDINDAVIKVQQITGFEITPEWWGEHVGNHGATEDILDRFDTAFEEFVHEQMGVSSPEDVAAAPERAVLAEADTELQQFDEQFGDDPGAAPLKIEFLNDLEDHLKEKYFSDKVIIPTETDGYSGKIRLADHVATVTINSGTYPELERFQVVNDAPVNELFKASIATAEDGSVVQELPTDRKINEIHDTVFGNEPNHLRVTLLDDEDTTEIDAPTYWGYLANGQIPIAGAKDTNYFIHDRAIDDHVLGWVLSPEELDDFIQKAGQAMTEQGIDAEKVKEAVAAYDFLTSTITLYAWRKVNGEDAPLPLRGNPNDSMEAQTKESEYRLGYAPDAIGQMVQKIEAASGTTLSIDIPTLLKKIDSRAQVLHQAIGV